MMLQNKKDNHGLLGLPSQKYRDWSEKTAVQVTEDDPCRSKSEYFSISPSTLHHSRWNCFDDVETDAIPKSPSKSPRLLISDSPSPYDEDLEHDGEVSSSVVSSPSEHISPSSSSSSSLSSSSVLSPFSSMSKGFLSSLPSFPENNHQAAVLSIASYQESGSVPDNKLFADFSNRNSGSQGVTSDLRSARCCSSQYIEEQSRTDSDMNRPYLPYINQSNFDVEQSILERNCSAKSSTPSNSSCKYSIAVDENEPDCARKTEPMETDRYPDKTLEKNPLLTDSAQAVLNMGYLPKHVKQAVDNVLKTKTWQTMNVEDILDVITENDEENSESAKTQNEASAADDIKNPEKLKESNETLRERTICKMCCTERVSIVFLPCGHLVSCGQCSPALRKCPMCRQGIKGTVRVKFN